ncbi:hypothetical protein K450DRAFT_223170 [Umbelopsis ramanniana AG]|uniref:Transcription factor domain-containing protein n=1 Tax=Umbelopsis ramanniana AG TaxID=1314678 RepID=A0AAD5EGK9_UMBRA|nr:uncharacterized protein K450DRAFT_223170 [Umbelopsis ramanniana AG]KAI8583343.1 hypothetical protein K450DRAFT_223170 [Umbelopsis ramanniana AG]
MAFATDDSREPKPTKSYRENQYVPLSQPQMQASNRHKPSDLPSAPVMIPNDIPNLDQWNKSYGFCYIPQEHSMTMDTIPLFSSAFNFLGDIHTHPIAMSPPQTPLTNAYENNGHPTTPTEYSAATSEYSGFDVNTLMPASPPESYASANSPTPAATEVILNEALSSFHISYGESGISMETNVSSASGLRSLIETFSQIGITPKSPTSHNRMSFSSTTSDKSNVLSKNRQFSTQPVNFFEKLGRALYANQRLEQTTALKQQIVSGCVDAFFVCWIRYSPVLNRQQFEEWYHSEPLPTDTFLVNAICAFTVKHMMIHHPCAASAEIPLSHNHIKDMESYFFEKAKQALEQNFDHSDRYSVIGMLLMAFRAEDKKATVYSGMATRALHELDVSPRMLSQHATIDYNDNAAYEKELDTRLWWFAWVTDFAVYSGGGFSKNTPQTRFRGEVDLPQPFPQDKNEAAHAIPMYRHGLQIWRLQADIIYSLYESSDDDALTTEQLDSFELTLQELRTNLPDRYRLDTGYQFTTPSAFIGCLRIQIELCATHIILHKLFLPDASNIEQMSDNSLISLNRCLYSAIQQLKMLKTTLELPGGACSFDRDELWRSSEIISMALTIHSNCSTKAQQLIMEGIEFSDIQGALPLALQIIRNTREDRFGANLNFSQLKEWIEEEIKKHNLTVPQPINFSQHKQRPEPKEVTAAIKKKTLYKQETDYDTVSFTISPSTSSPPSTSHPPNKMHKSSHTKSTSNIAVQFQNSFGPPPSPAVSSPMYTKSEAKSQRVVETRGFVNQVGWSSTYVKGQPRFRYFSPKTSDKLMFIDENPMV